MPAVQGPEFVGETARRAADAVWAISPSWNASRLVRTERSEQCRLLRDIIGPLPFRLVAIDPSLLEWNSGTVARLAQASYDNRQLPAGTLEPERLMVLADAMEDAGCRDLEVLAHLREQGRGHVHGCHVVDLLLGKS
jgi:hypothetical protein